MPTIVPIESVAPAGYKPRKTVPIESVMPDGYEPVSPAPTAVDLSGVRLNPPRNQYEPSGMGERFGAPRQRPIEPSSYALKDYADRISGTPATVDARAILDAVPFVGGVSAGTDAQALQGAATRAKAGTATEEDLQVLKAYQLDAARGATLPAQVAGGVAGSVRMGLQALIGSMAAGPVGAFAGMAADPGMAMSRMATQQTPEITVQVNEGGKPTSEIAVGKTPSATTGEAAAKTAALQVSDAIIEMFGGKAISGAMGYAGKKIAGAAAKRLPSITKGARAFASRYGDNTLAKVLDAAEIQGIAPEYMEEVLQSAAAAQIGEPGADPAALLDPTNPEALQTALVIGVLGSPRLLGMFQKAQEIKNGKDNPPTDTANAGDTTSPSPATTVSENTGQPAQTLDQEFAGVFDEAASNAPPPADTFKPTNQTDISPVQAPTAAATPSPTQAPPAPENVAPSPPQAAQEAVAPAADPEEAAQQHGVTYDGPQPRARGKSPVFQFTDPQAGNTTINVESLDELPAKVEAKRAVYAKAKTSPTDMPATQTESERIKAELDRLDARRKEREAKNQDEVYLDRMRGIMRPEVALARAKESVQNDPDPEYTQVERAEDISDLDSLASMDSVIQGAMKDVPKSHLTDPSEDLYRIMGIPSPGGDMRTRLGSYRFLQSEGASAFDIESPKVLQKLTERIYKAQAETDGLDPDALMGSNSGLTEAGKEARGLKARNEAQRVLDKISSFMQEATVAPEPIPQPQPEATNETQGQKAEVLNTQAGVAETSAAAPAAQKREAFSLPKTKRSPDDPSDVAESAYGTFGRVGKNETVPIESLSGGVRMDDPKEAARVQALANKISSPDGYIDRLVVDRQGNVQEGQHRLEALRLLGAKQVPVSRVYDISEGMPIDKMREAVSAVGGLRREQVDQIVANVAEMEGDDYDLPRGYEKYYKAAIDAKNVATPAAPPPTTPAPIRFKRTGKGDAAVHEATIEGRAVAISKGKDGWSVTLDGKVADVHPTLKEAREYATGELRQDLVDERNAAEEESLAGGEPVFNKDNPPYHLMDANQLGAVKKADSAREARRALNAAKSGKEKPGVFTNGFKSKAALVRARQQALDEILDRPEIEFADVWTAVTDAANMPSKPSIPKRVVDSEKSNIVPQLEENLASKGYELNGDNWVYVKKPTGPSPADTGIFRDLTAAAREGKRFVEDLHARIAPVLARIHAATKSPVEFMRAAVAKIGEHIRPYVKRFLADVRKVNAEFAANQTRGSVPAPEGGKKKSDRIDGKEPEQAPLLKAKKGEQTRQSGVAQGQREGMERQRQDAKAMYDIAREVLPAGEWAAIAKAGRRIMSLKGRSEAVKRKALDKLLEKHLDAIEHAKSLKKAKKSISSLHKDYKKLRPEIQQAFGELLDSFRTSEVSETRYDKALSVVARVAAGDETVTPKALASATEAIESYEETDKKELLRNLSKDDLDRLSDAVEALKEQNAALNSGIAEKITEQKKKNKEQAPAEVTERAEVSKNWNKVEDKVQNLITFALDLPNVVRGIAKKNTHVFNTLVTDLLKGDTDTQEYLKKHMQSLEKKLTKAGITPEKIRKMSAVIGDAEEVEVAGMKMVPAERISIMLHLSDPDTRAKLFNKKSKGFIFSRGDGESRTLKLTPEIAREIEDSATADERKVVGIMFDWANGELRDDVNEWSLRTLGYQIFRDAQHWNRRRKITDTEPAVGLLAKDAGTAQMEATGYLKERTGGTSYIVVDDVFQHVVSHMNSVSALMGKYEASVNARRLLGSEGFQESVKRGRKNGKKVLGVLNRRVDDWGAIKTPDAEGMLRVVRAVGRRYASAKLAFNLSVIISQPFSVLSAQKVIPIKHILAGLKELRPNKEVFREIASAKGAADLYFILNGGGQHIVTPGSTSAMSAGQVFKTTKDPLNERLMIGIQRGNEVAVYKIWEAAKRWGKEKGLTGDALMDFTAEKATDAWLQTQPSHSSVYQPGIKMDARKSAAAYAATMFQGQTSIQFQDAIDSLRDYQELPREKQTVKAKAVVLAKMARPTIMQGMMFHASKYGIGALLSLILMDEKDRKKKEKNSHEGVDFTIDSFMSFISSIPAAGPMIGAATEFAKRSAFNEPVVGGAFDNPIIDAINQAFGSPVIASRITNAIASGKDPRPSDLRNMLKTLDLTGLPVSAVFKWIEGLSRFID